MTDVILTWLRALPPELTTLIIAALPIVEVRGAVPVAIELFQLPVATAMLLSFIGSAVPAMLLPVILSPLEAPVRKYVPYMDELFTWITKHVERRYTERYRALGAIGLTVFIAIPLPVTGVWTGSLAAWLFQLPKRFAIPAIMIGTAISTLIVTATTLSGFALLRAVL